MVTLTLRQRRRILILVNVALVAAIAGAVCGLTLIPLGVPDPDASARTPRTQPAAASRGDGLASLEGYSVIHRRDVRKPLHPRVKVDPLPPPRPKLQLTLTGTVGAPGAMSGIFVDKSGRPKLVSAGESIGGAEVMAVSADSAVVKFHGETITLPVKKVKSR